MQEMPGAAPMKYAGNAGCRARKERYPSCATWRRGTRRCIRRAEEIRRVLPERLLAKMRNSMICKKKIWWRNKSFLQKARNRNMHRRASCKIRKISVMQEMPGAVPMKYAGNAGRRARKERCPNCATWRRARTTARLFRPSLRSSQKSFERRLHIPHDFLLCGYS